MWHPNTTTIFKCESVSKYVLIDSDQTKHVHSLQANLICLLRSFYHLGLENGGGNNEVNRCEHGDDRLQIKVNG